MKRLAPLAWISLGLVCLTVSLILAGDALVGLAREHSAERYDYRRKLCEALAVQYSELTQKGEIRVIQTTMEALVARNPDVLSTALRLADGTLIAEAGEHPRHWVPSPNHRSTLTHVQVPIFQGDRSWGTVEFSFQADPGLWPFWANRLVRFTVFVAAAGFLCYLLWMKKTLRHLDPSAVISARVQAALDILVEGVVLLDAEQRIVLVNAAFANQLRRPAAALIGSRLATLDWVAWETDAPITEYPWTRAAQAAESQTGVRLALGRGPGEMCKFAVHSSPVLDEEGQVRGTISTFDDVTALEQVHAHLRRAMTELETSRQEVLRQNEELQRLVTRDSLTGCLNRRAFLERLEAEFSQAKSGGGPLGCIMADIDFFKSYNDRYGHSVGDQVIQVVAKTISAELRSNDALCRYGGEEFCILLPNLDAEEAATVAERIRQRIASESGSAIRTIPGIKITASFGVVSLRSGAMDPSEFVEHADQALYAAKEGGRNRVARWDTIRERTVQRGVRVY